MKKRGGIRRKKEGVERSRKDRESRAGGKT
jgi:hypothetical protein